MRKTKRTIAVILSAIMTVSAFSSYAVAVPITASAAESQESVGEIYYKYGDFEYVVEDDQTCTITEYNGSAKNVIIPSSINGHKVYKVGTIAFFYNENITSVTIPNSVEIIDDAAFEGCNSLSSVTFPNNLKKIGDSAFSDTNLTKVTIPNSVKEIGAFAFSECKNLSSITLSNQLKGIETGNFENCKSLTSISFPNSVSFLGAGILDGCTSLKTVSIGSNLHDELIEVHFSNCTALESITVSSSNNTYSSIDGVLYDKKKTELLLYPRSKKATTYTVPSTIKNIYCDINNPYLKTVIIPSSVTYIGSYTVGYTCSDGVNYKKVSGFTIKGYKGTEAESYAKNYGFNFVQLQTAPTSVSLNKTSLSLNVGKTYTLTKTVSPSNATTSYTWSSSNTSVATVDKNGKVTAKGVGTATITVKTSNGKTATCKVTVNVATPQISSLSNTTGGIKLTWNKVTGTYGYRVYVKTSSGWKKLKDTTATSLTDSAVTANQTKTYTIRCIDKNGKTISGYNSKGWSKKYTAATPKITKLSNTSKGVSVTWNKIAGVYGYRVYRKYAGGSWTKVKDTTATSLTDSGAKKGKKVTYTVRCIDKKGKTVSGYNTTGWSITRK